MADTGTVVVTKNMDPAMNRIVFAWTADGSGNAELTIDGTVAGLIMGMKTIPGTVGATYEVVIEDDLGEDILEGITGTGNERSTSATEHAQITIGSLGCPAPTFTGSIVFKINGAASGNTGTAILYYKGNCKAV